MGHGSEKGRIRTRKVWSEEWETAKGIGGDETEGSPGYLEKDVLSKSLINTSRDTARKDST